MKKAIGFSITVFFLLFSVFCCVSEGTPQQDSNPSPQVQQQTPVNWTGDGGKGMSLAILAPKASGLAENQDYLPALVQGEFVSNFSGFSAIEILDRQRLDEQYAELLSGYYDDTTATGLDLGHLTPTTHILGGNITRTATGYALQMQITKTADKMTEASYSGTFTFAELDNLTGIRKASLDLLQSMGVTLTAKARGELSGAATANHVSAQTTLAQGITAQRQGTEVAALSYYFQAATYDPSLMEALNRSSILNANITSGNIGDNVRNDIQWRRDWVTRLTETEQYFFNFNRTESMPYTLFYTTEIKQGAINYEQEIVTLSIETHLHGSGIWTVSMERALQAVYDGLNATKRKEDWGLANWPQQGVTNLNAFQRRSGNFSVVFELLNSQDKVIDIVRQPLQTGGYWELSRSGRPVISVSADERKTLYFGVKANDITDRMTVRVATVNGTNAETAARNGVLQIRASSNSEFAVNDKLKFSRGEIQGFADNSAKEGELVIPDTIWGDPVISIGDRAFVNNKITSVIFPDSVKTIGEAAFHHSEGVELRNGNYVTTYHGIAIITIGANVNIAKDAFQYTYTYKDSTGRTVNAGLNVFQRSYNNNHKVAGIYASSVGGVGGSWKYFYPSPFPPGFIGTWKRDSGTVTLTFSNNTIKASNQSYFWYIYGISGDSYKLFDITRAVEVPAVTIKLVDGDLQISDNQTAGNPDNQIFWNGIWRKQ